MYVMNFKFKHKARPTQVFTLVGASASKLKKWCLIQFGELPDEWVILNRRGESEESSHNAQTDAELRIQPRTCTATFVW